MQFAQLFFVHRVRRLGHEAGGALGLGEGDHVADRLGAGHQRDQPIQPEGQAAVGRRAELQRVEQEAEFFLGFLGADVERAGTPCSALPGGGYAPSRRRLPSRSAPCRRPWTAPCRDRCAAGLRGRRPAR